MKKRSINRFLSTLMALLLAVSMLAVNVYADTDDLFGDQEDFAIVEQEEAQEEDLLIIDDETEEAEEELEVSEKETADIKPAAAGETVIALNNCKVIGYDDEDEDNPVPNFYYINIGDASTTVQLTDLPDELEEAMITNFVGSVFGDGTNIVDLSKGYDITYDWLMTDGYEAYGHYIDTTLITEDMDLSNLYAIFVMDEEYSVYYILIQGVHKDPPVELPFTLSAGEFTGLTPEGYSYSYADYMTGETVTIAVDLYTVSVPLGTAAVDLGFEENRLAYGYSAMDSNGYACSCSTSENGDYADILTGEKAATVRAFSDGKLPAYVQVQTPYDASWNSTTLYAIQFVPTYAFTASYNGKELTNITFEADSYTCNDMYGAVPTVGTFTLTIPNDATSIDFVLSDPVLHYNYTYSTGLYLGGAVTDFYNGDTTFSQATDYDSNGVLDCLQIQTPYDSMWNTTLHYVILFAYADQTVDPGQTPEDIPGDVADIYANVEAAMNTTMAAESSQTYGSEWFVMDLERAGIAAPQGYYQNVLKTVLNKKGILHTIPETGSSMDYTNYARVILALTAGGYDPRDIGGYDLTAALADYDAIMAQGLNGAMYALLALDSGNYAIPTAAAGVTQTTREKLINAILNSQHEDGGWAYGADEASDPDMTAIALQALAPYYQVYSDVNAAVEKALTLLSSMETAEGTFKSEDAQGEPTSESTSMVIIALTALGINPDTDARFVKGEISPIDGLCSFWTEGGFKHVASGAKNAMATDQGYRALVSYYRLLEGQTSLYDMTDVELQTLKLLYEDSHINFIKADGAGFGMWSPYPGTTVSINEDNVVIHYVPKNKTTYAGFVYGYIKDGNYADETVVPVVDVSTNEDGTMDITLSKENCGTAIPIAPIKKTFKSNTWTSSDQYFLAIPTEEDILATGGHSPMEAVTETFPVTYAEDGHIDTVVYCSVCVDGNGIREELSREIEITDKALKDQAAEAIAAADEAAAEAATHTGEAGAEAAQAAAEAAEAAQAAAQAAYNAAVAEGLDPDTIAEAQGVLESATQAAEAAEEKAEAAVAAADEAADVRDAAVATLAQLDGTVDKTLYTASSYAVYEEAFNEFKALVLNDEATTKQLRTARSAVTRAYTSLVLKDKQDLTLKASSKSVGYATTAAGAKTYSMITVSGAADGATVKYSKSSGSSYLTVNSSTGKITVKKGTPAGKQTATIKVTSSATDDFLAASKTVKVTVTVNKAAQPMTAKGSTKTVKAANVKKANQTVTKAVTVSKAQGTVTYKKTSGDPKITINSSSGKITVKKGLAKGTYKVQIKVTAAGNKNYKSGSKTVTVTIKVN